MEGPGAETVAIRYRRPPDREEIFRQRLVHEEEGVLVTLAVDLDVEPPVRVGGEPVLEKGSDAVWFTFPGVWHDIGRFHTADGLFRGWYANILVPPTFEEGGVWRTTDLFLDLWIAADEAAQKPAMLDREQFEEACLAGWIDETTRGRAEEEVRRLLMEHRGGRWPPPVARRWTRERAREALGQASSSTI